MSGLKTKPWCIGLALAGLVACGNFNALSSDLDKLDGTCRVQGEAEVVDWSGRPLIIVALNVPQDASAPMRVHDALNDEHPGSYVFRLPPGTYRFGAYEDQNADGEFQNGERGFLSGPIEINQVGKTVRGPRLTVRDALSLPRPLTEREVIEAYPYTHGDVVPLTDARFGQEVGHEGLWAPWTSVAKHRPGIYFLRPYEPTRTPVLFVHGMSGYPQEFQRLIERLDPTRFQAWVALYPSGYELASVVRLLAAMLSRVEIEYDPERICIVAHSMGGLVARGALLALQRTRPENRVRTLVTINSPFGGMPSAAWGVRMAPEVVPAWMDLVPDSEFLKNLFRQRLSERIEYHLLFAFDESGTEDGVVSLESQLRVEAQADAAQVRGYRATHTGSLHSAAVAAQVLRALDRCSGLENESMVAPRPPEPHVVQ